MNNRIDYISASALLVANKRKNKVYGGKYEPLPSLKQRMEIVSYFANRTIHIAPIRRLK